jgi:hypothetical protein
LSRSLRSAAAISIVALGACFLRAAGGASADTLQPAAAASPGPVPPSGAQTAPPVLQPSATASPNALIISGYLRAYDFDRLNAFQNKSNPNRSAFNLGGSLQLDYHLGDSPFHAVVGGFAGDPFGINGGTPNFNKAGPGGANGIDNSLPGYSYSTLGIINLRYDDSHLRAVVGDQLYDSPWANPADSRMKPALFQGISTNYAFDRHFDVGLSRMIAFESRIDSNFTRYTLLPTTLGTTENTAEGFDPNQTPGFLAVDARYHNGPNSFVSLWGYSFYNIANLGYVEAGAGLDPASPYHPTLSGQFVTESQAGSALEGRIQNDTFGAKLAADVTHNFNLSFGFDTAPWRYYDFTAASGSAATTAAGKVLFTPGVGNGIVVPIGGGVYRAGYGGIASPYTDSYASDPLYTTSISQGVVDARSAGTSYKVALTFTSDNKRVKVILSEAYYDYANFAFLNNTTETDGDFTYYFSPPPKSGPYHGLLYRERIANRLSPGSQAGAQLYPHVFTYTRQQLQYQF